jgi:hypothetical protein
MITFKNIIEALNKSIKVTARSMNNMEEVVYYVETSWLIKEKFKPMVDGVGISSKVSQILLNHTSVAEYYLIQPWIQDVFIIIFILWPIGANKLEVMRGIQYLSDEALSNPRIKAASMIIKKIIRNINEIEAGTTTDIATVRHLFPRLSFWAHLAYLKNSKKFLPSIMEDETYFEVANRCNFPPTLMLVPSKEWFEKTMRQARSAISYKGKDWLDHDNIRNMTRAANAFYLMEEARIMTKDMKKAILHNDFSSSSMKSNTWMSFLDSKVDDSSIDSTFEAFHDDMSTSWMTDASVVSRMELKNYDWFDTKVPNFITKDKKM